MKCKTGCGADVQWAIIGSSGKHVLLDLEPSDDGRYVILPNIGARVATDVDRRLLRPLYRCHWDVCEIGGS